MKFLCDVHISYKICKFLMTDSFEAIHVNDILDKSETKDSALIDYADTNNFVIITKDSDFRDSYFVKRSPKKLIKINLGNIPNSELVDIFRKNMEIIKTLESRPHFLIEIDSDKISLME